MRTIKECEAYVNVLNSCMFQNGSKFYFRINYCNGYKALDRYERCLECLKKQANGINVVCNKDRLVENVWCYTTDELYEVTRVISRYRYLAR